MYSPEIREMLDSKGIEVGDRIRADGKEGQLMPKPESGDEDVLLLKLDSGYNIGVEAADLELVEKNEIKERKKKPVEHEEDLPDIMILHTGGTIASRISYEEGGVKPEFDPEDLVEMYPELAEEVNIHSEVVAQMLSEDMEPGHWVEVAEKIDEVKDEYDGIIVGHGTDTMQYTGAALSLMLQNIDTGVMLVGAQRSSDRPSSDAAMNLYCAARFLKATDFQGFGVCMHSTPSDTTCDIMPAHKVRKMHTSRRDAFKPVNTGIIGKVDYESGEIVEESHGEPEGEYRVRTGIERDIGYLKVRPGMEPEEIEFLKDQGYEGVIVEGTGLGHMPVNAFDDRTQHHDEILEKLEELAGDAVVVMTSQCINGRVNMNVYDAGLKIQQAGVIEAGDMHPELAYVKLAWALGNSEDLEEAREKFQEDFSGEITRRSVYSD